METAVSEVRNLVPGVLPDEVAALETRRGVPGLDLFMVESLGGPGEVTGLPLPHLVLSPAISRSFHYQCDLGAGRFSGQGTPMDFVLVPPKVPTWCRIDNPHRLRFLAIPFSLAQRLLGRPDTDPLDFGVLHSRQNRDPFISQTLETLWHELAEADTPHSRLFLESATASVLARLERLSSESLGPPPAVGGLATWQSARVLDYMREHLAESISLSELAGLVDLSPWHFARAFRQHHQLPPHRCLTQLRMEKARDLLAHSQLSITEVAMATGYSSQHLARHFRRYLGCTPREYRRQSRQ